MFIASQTTTSNPDPPSDVLIISSMLPDEIPSGVCVGIARLAGTKLTSKKMPSVDLSPGMAGW